MIFTTYCILCQSTCNNPQPLCQTCKHRLTYHTQPIKFAKLPTIIAPFHYEVPISYFITQLKFQHKLVYSRILANLFLEYYSQFNTQKPDIIIPVPLHKKRLCKRGFNQAIEIAKPIGKALQIPLDIKNIIRHKNTLPQSKLSAHKRQSNVHNAFSQKQFVSNKHIAILDDVITTGSTLTALINCIRQNNISSLQIWTLATATK